MYFSSSREPIIEKDPFINKMRMDVFKAMEDVMEKAFPKQTQVTSPHEIKFVSFEEALKELAQFNQN